MIQQIRTSKASKIIATSLAIMIFMQVVAPYQAYALTEGPSQPEFNSFTPIGTSDMVDLSSGDFNYNIPIMDVGGYPINLSYSSGITMDQEASWVGLGWNLNIGQITRQVRGLPDDFKGDEIETDNNMRKNITIGVNPYINGQIIGSLDNLSAGAGLNVQYNNYTGLSAVPSFGMSFKINDNVAVGMQLSSSAEDGVSVTPNATFSLSKGVTDTKGNTTNLKASISPSITYNSRQGLQSFNLSSAFSANANEDSEGANFLESGGSGGISFLNNTFTPSKRLAFNNESITFAFSGGPDVFGGHVEFSITAYASVQTLKEKSKIDKAYGYDFTQNATEEDLLDFNREKEASTVTKNTLVLPVTNYTYDIYSIQSQGASGQFRPYRSQVGHVFDAKVVDGSDSDTFGLEAEGGAGAHAGLNKKHTDANTYTGRWNVDAVNYFNYTNAGSKKDYEAVYYKMVGETKADDEGQSLLTQLGDSAPVTLTLDINKNATNTYAKKTINGGGYESILTPMPSFYSPIKRDVREKRNKVIQKISKKEAQDFDLDESFINVNTNSYAKPHHTAAFIVTDENGSRHIFGETAYNKEKKEVSFAVGGNSFVKETGLVQYGGQDNTTQNGKGVDHYFNSEKTPAYAHTYLLTSVLSPDYEDVTGNGPTDDDMGSYTKFDYVNKGDYRWRTPYKSGSASYNEGLKTLKGPKGDQKGSYVYGVKESKYVSKITTKTHVAFIDLKPREDGYGVEGENGGSNLSTTSRMYYIESIRLYSKPEVTVNGVVHDPTAPNSPVASVTPIKKAHFVYDYFLFSLTQIENNHPVSTGNQGGKLTLRKVYFTYRGSNMGRYTAYEFNYDGLNPAYMMKDFDVWGNYKKQLPNADFTDNNKQTSPQEFPYVNQNSTEIESIYDTPKEQQDAYASAWSLTSIDLPSGGRINVTYESDDYQYVQNRKAAQMFKVAGVSIDESVSSINSDLYGNGHAKYVVVKIDPQDTETTISNFKERYFGEIMNKPIFFNFLLNMTSGDYEYIQGYFELDGEPKLVTSGSDKYIFIPMKKINKEGRISGTKNANPISVAGWFFGRENLNRQVNEVPMDQGDNINVVDVGKELVNNLQDMLHIFEGGNERLEDRNCARNFKKDKSWIRLQEPTGRKLGGGCRVKKIIMQDEWDNMGSGATSNVSLYKKEYGQEYDYTLPDFTETPDDNPSSGVATYEPFGSKENPFIEPFYHKPEKLTARDYEEKPFGESFYPAAQVTYSRVTVKNITSRDNDAVGDPVSYTTTGKVVTQHYTSYDFPTLTDFTTLDSDLAKRFQSNEDEAVGNMLKGMLGLKINVNTNLTMTQGFTIETNDMNGKLKKQEVFNNAGALISSVEHKYNTTGSEGNIALNNVVTVINEAGAKSQATVGVEYDVINDFRESYAYTNTKGVSANVDLIPLGIPFVVGYGVPERAEHTQALRMVTTTKVIHKTGLLTETIAFDGGSRVTTKNVAWDKNTGQVLLTETINEFDDKYYSFNYPAYWKYKEMDMSSVNIDISGKLSALTINEFSIVGLGAEPIQNYLKLGDEIIAGNYQSIGDQRMWVFSYVGTNKVKLMKRNGAMVTTSDFADLSNAKFRVIRSGYRNQQMASMASVTSMVSPLPSTPTGNISYSASSKVINASAVTYNQSWSSQCECNLPDPATPNINPYLYNISGDWRPNSSWAYLTGRDASTNFVTRKAGFYSTFTPYYTYSGVWDDNPANWVTASTVTKYSPKGMEIENMDALGRYSSAQYGHNHTLPVAVASNSRYSDMGYQSFEDDVDPTWQHALHFGFSQQFSCDFNETFEVVNTESHTGQRSLKISENKAKHICYYHNQWVEGERDDCFSFKPTSNKYIISAWVKEESSTQQKTYANTKMVVTAQHNTSGVLSTVTLVPTGVIIDGWQKIEGEFNFNYNMPIAAQVRLAIGIENMSTTKDLYVDDIRIHPVEATMKSFAYDRTTQRLMAELDENNYATIYEYDKEGGLVRVKKETESGIYTIQETRSGNRKLEY